LDAVEPKPDVSGTREEKHAYAARLSRRLAVFAASALRSEFPRILPTEGDVGHESVTGGSEGGKRLDVKAWDDVLGLELLVSIKTYSFQDWDGRKRRAGRYTKNVKRNGFELMHEADVIHRRQPYSVMVGLPLALPERPLRGGDRWPKAARGADGEAYAIDASVYPLAVDAPHLHEFLEHELSPLSLRAASGFLRRTSCSSLRFPQGLLRDVGNHIDLMNRAQPLFAA
jgi:hypothetical protein